MLIHIKGEQGASLQIEINSRLYENSEDYWDGNFLKSSVKAISNGFSASFSCNLRADELNQWLNSMESFLRDNKESISLSTMEENINLKGRADSLGSINWECGLKNNEDLPSMLSFTIVSSIAAIQDLRDDLRSLLNKYPIIGKPY